MKRFVLALALFSLSAPVFAQESSVPAGTNQKVMLFRNVSGSTLTSKTAVIFDLDDSNLTTGTDVSASNMTLGLDVDTTTTADQRFFAGVLLDDSCVDDQVCRFVREGPALVRFAGSTDNTNSVGAEIGTTTVAGNLGAGTGAGWLLSWTVSSSDCANSATVDNSCRWVWLNPDNI